MASPAFLSPPSEKKKKKMSNQNHTPPPLIGACFLMQGAFSHSAGSGRPPLMWSRTWRPCHFCPRTVCDVLSSCICLPPLCDEGRAWQFYFRVPSMMPGSFSVGLKRTNQTWHVASSSRTSLHFLTDSSKELEELRSAFARALEYLKQEVEERKWASRRGRSCCLFCSVYLFSQRRFASQLLSDFVYFCSSRFQWEWRSKLPDHAELGSDWGKCFWHIVSFIPLWGTFAR